MFSNCPSVRLSVRPFIRLSSVTVTVTKLVNKILFQMNESILMQIGTSGSRGQEHEMINVVGQRSEVKVTR